MEPIYLAVFFLALVALGEVLSIKSRAKIPTLLVVIGIVFILLQAEVLPPEFIEATTFVAFGSMLVPILIVHLGTMIPLSVMKKQYQAVIITGIGLLISVVSVLTIVTFLFNYETAVAGTGPITGGIIAYLITAEGLRAAGLTTLVAIPVTIFALQNFIGMPLTSILLSRYAKSIRTDTDNHHYAKLAAATDQKKQAKKLLIPERYLESNFIILFILFCGGALAVFLDQLTGINASLFALVIGVTGTALRVFPEKALEQANSSGITMVALFFVVLASLVGVTWNEIVASIAPALVIMFIGITGLVLGGLIGAKIFKWKPTKAIPVVLTALYGFPGDYLIVEEVARSTGRDEVERKRIMDELVAPMLIGGFTSVTVGSIAIASILIGTLS
ncbi:hypothetical protein [Geomicrobium sp. JCM 19038]|uniref:hypothetical protein n=1 Tax=Geomicrobium sp. JCM 19038 TaxID=1460635 RepID=UPI00045F4C80|nr:hypothetical protein [Geomicrobium sp. JCM 19038]GAK07668.1 integral membrane protein [Geomicrobium sp. JCM 19038]